MKRKIIIFLLFLFFALQGHAQLFDVDADLEGFEDAAVTAPEIFHMEDSLISYAREFVGTKYKYGGKTPDGFDCSGFVNYVFKAFGANLPASSREMSNIGNEVKLDEVQKGDLIFFEGRTRNKQVGHVGIVCDVNEKSGISFIHASVSSNVTITNMNDSYFKVRFLKGKRVLPIQ